MGSSRGISSLYLSGCTGESAARERYEVELFEGAELGAEGVEDGGAAVGLDDEELLVEGAAGLSDAANLGPILSRKMNRRNWNTESLRA